MTPHSCFVVDEASRVGEARRHAALLAAEAGLDDAVAGRVALIVTELGNNLVRHATGGRLLLRAHAQAGCFEVLSVDTGPGMADVQACLADGYSTAGTPGTGLGAAKRQSSDFDIWSAVDHGTAIACVVRPAGRPARPRPGYEVGGVCLAAPGETVSGDAWAVRLADHQATVLVADGLGHGPEAAAAADRATAVFDRRAEDRPSDHVQTLHTALRDTRGAAVAVLRLDAVQRSVTICGAGNIAGRLISGLADRSLLTQHGTAGVQVRTPRDQEQPWPDHAIVLLHSDGVGTRWDLQATPGLLQHSALAIAAWIVIRHLRGRDDATVVVLRWHD